MLSGLGILCFENEQAESLEKIVEDFTVHKTHRMLFTQVS